MGKLIARVVLIWHLWGWVMVLHGGLVVIWHQTMKTPPSTQIVPPVEWLRVSEAVQFSRISKPKIYDLINRGLIKSCSLKERGQIKGTRLISFDSLKAFLESRASGGENLPT